MLFPSILFKNEDDIKRQPVEEFAFFSDLNLNQIIDSITAGKEEYNLNPFFYTALRDVETVYYRHEVMRDMENETLMGQIKVFAERMASVRRNLGLVEKLDFNYHKKGWFLEATRVYCDAMTDLAHNLSQVNLKSSGLLAFREYVTGYVKSHGFQEFTQKNTYNTVTY